jgi:hypothetical protein
MRRNFYNEKAKMSIIRDIFSVMCKRTGEMVACAVIRGQCSASGVFVLHSGAVGYNVGVLNSNGMNAPSFRE